MHLCMKRSSPQGSMPVSFSLPFQFKAHEPHATRDALKSMLIQALCIYCKCDRAPAMHGCEHFPGFCICPGAATAAAATVVATATGAR